MVLEDSNMSNKTSISILGCGWLGLPLAKALIQKGYDVAGSTTSPEKINSLIALGVKPFTIALNPDFEGSNKKEFFESDILIVAFPPRIKVNGESYYLSQVQRLAEIAGNRKTEIIFLSSTSVYGFANKEMTEDDVDKEHVLFKAEEILRAGLKNKVTVLRLSGLMGYDRIPCKYYSGKKGLSNGETPVNYIFRDDVIGIVSLIIERGIWNETFNVTAPIHPTRKEVMEPCCEQTQFEMPEFIASKETAPFKIINSDRLQAKLGYHFIYPNPLDFPYPSMEM